MDSSSSSGSGLPLSPPLIDYRLARSMIENFNLIPSDLVRQEGIPSPAILLPPPSPSEMTEIEEAAEKKLSDDMKALQFDGYFADVVFYFEDGSSSVRAHKALLVARSPVFADMFLHGKTISENFGLLEKDEGPKIREKKEVNQYGDDDIDKDDGITHVTITDTISDVFQHLLLFIYTDELSTWKLEMIAADLLVAAEKYKLVKLKRLCEKQLTEELATEHKTWKTDKVLQLAADRFELASAHNAAELKSASAKCMAELMKAKLDQLEKSNPENLLKLFRNFQISQND